MGSLFSQYSAAKQEYCHCQDHENYYQPFGNLHAKPGYAPRSEDKGDKRQYKEYYR